MRSGERSFHGLLCNEVGQSSSNLNVSDHTSERLLPAEASVVFAETGRYDMIRNVSQSRSLSGSMVGASSAALTASTEHRDADVTIPAFTCQFFHPSTRGSHGFVRA